ncbi:MAG: hypothetical protein M3O23_04745 [Actinomycetota bacterium]|nr:hypothetical protein [Actinomycetota bacterium]
MSRRDGTPFGHGAGEAAAVLFLLAVAAAVRVPALSTLGLYRDDAWPMLATRTDVGRAVRIGVTIPGFEAFLRAWGTVSASTPWAQAPALLASLAAVAGAYLVARRLGCDRAAAIVAGGVMALAPMAVLFATRVKPYAADALAALVLVALAVRVSERPTTRRWTALVVVAVIAPVFSASVLPVALTAVAWSGWRTWRAGGGLETARWAAWAVPAGYVAVVAVYALLVLGNVPPPLRDSWASHYVDGVGSARFVLDEFAAGVFYRHGPTGPLLLAAVVVGVVWARRDLAPLLLGPVAVAFGLAVVDRAPFGGGRTDVYLYPCVALAVALTAQKALQRVRVPGTVLAVAAAVVLFAATVGRTHADRNAYPGADTARLIAAVRGQMAPGDGVVVAPFTRYAFALYDRPRPRLVLSSRYSTGFTVASPDPNVLIMPAEFYETGYDAAAAVPFARDRARVWYLATDTPRSDTPVEVQAHEYEPERRLLEDGFVVERRLDVDGAHANLLVRPRA